MKQNRINLAPWAIFAAACIGAFVAPFLFPSAQAQRARYIEGRSDGTAFANQLAPNPVTGMCLQPDVNNRTVWGPCGSLPAGTVGKVLGAVPTTATRTVLVTGTQTSTATETYSYIATETGTATGTQTATGATVTYTLTATGTTTGLFTQGYNSFVDARWLQADSSAMVYVTSESQSQLRTINASDPNSPTTVNTYATCTTPRGVLVTTAGCMVACPDNTFRFYSCSAGACTLSYTSTGVGSGTYSIAQYSQTMSGHVLLANYTANNVQTINKETGAVDGTVSTGSSSNPFGIVALSSTLGAVSCVGSYKLHVVDYSTPSSPTLRGSVTFDASPRGAYAWGGRYVAVAMYLGNQIKIVDTNDPDNPSVIATLDTGTGTAPYFVDGHGSLLYVTYYTGGQLAVIDASTPSSPTVLGTPVSVGTNPRGVSVPYPYTHAYVAVTGDNRVKVVDVSRYQIVTGSQTTTNTMTVTGTTTATQTLTVTGTQTMTNTGSVTSSAIGTTTGTGTEWSSINGTLYSGSHIRISRGTSTALETAVDMADRPTIHANGSAVPMASTLPISDADGLLNGWIYNPVAVADPFRWKYATGTNSSTSTSTSVDVTATRPTLTILPAPVTFACSTSVTNTTIITSFTLGTGNGLVVSTGQITPRPSTTSLRFRIGFLGKGNGTASPVTVNVQAITGPRETPTYTAWVPKAAIMQTVDSGYYVSGFNDVIAWDSHWANATAYELLMTNIVLPFSSEPTSTRACLEVEELQ